MRLLVLLALVLALPVHAQQDTPLHALQTGDAARGWEAVGRLDMSGVGFCTATLIAPDRVLTAAHCLFDRRTGAQIDVDRLEFRAGWRTGRADATRGVRRVAIWPSFQIALGADPDNVTEDFAVLELDRPVRTTAIRPFAVGDAPPFRGDAVAVVSYARNRAEAPSIQETCHIVDGRHDGLLVFSCDIDFGASGSPVFAQQDGELRVVSVISAQVQNSDSPRSMGMRLGGRVDELLAALDAGVAGVAATQPQGARSAARFVRP